MTMETLNCKACSVLIYRKDASGGYCKDCKIKRLKLGYVYILRVIDWRKMNSVLKVSSEEFTSILKSYLND